MVLEIVKIETLIFRPNQDQHLWKCSNYRKHCLGNPKVRQFCHYLQDHYFNPKHTLMFFILGAWRVLANWFTLQWSLEMLCRLVISCLLWSAVEMIISSSLSQITSSSSPHLHQHDMIEHSGKTGSQRAPLAF